MSDLVPILIGAVLAIAGGFSSDEFRAWRERQRESQSIKIALSDELVEMCAIIQKIHDVWESAKVFPPNLVADLLANTIVYDGLRTRLFLIKDEELRRSIHAFYKKLRDNIRKTEGKIGTLDDSSDAQSEQSAFNTAFQALGTEATSIKADLNK